MTKLTSLCVYCGSHEGFNGAFREAATELGGLLAERGVRLVFGGGGIGLMRVIADAVLDRGGEVVGVVPAHLRHVELGHPNLKELHVVDSMHERKQMMFELADAFAILPGGLGTLDEAIEIVTWKQLRLHDKPVVLVDHEGYWAPLRELIRHVIENGFAARESADLLSVVPNVAAIFPAIEAAPESRLKRPRSEL